MLTEEQKKIRSKGVVNNHHGPQMWNPDHPHRRKNGYVQESRLVAEKVLGKLLPLTSVVHHIDENPYNNSTDNLVLCQDQSYHMLLHMRMKSVSACGNPNYRKCKICKKWDDPTNMKFVLDRRWKNKEYPNYYHTLCSNDVAKKYYERHRTERKAHQNAYYTENRESINQKRRDNYANRKTTASQKEQVGR